MAKSVNTVPVSSKDTKVTTTVEAGDSWNSTGELAAKIARGIAK